MEGDRTRWEPLGQADLAVIGVVICVDSAVGLLVIHVAHRWSWSPYAAKVPLLAVTTGVAVSDVMCDGLIWCGRGSYYS